MSVEEEHRNWFKANYPGTFADMERGEKSAEMEFAHSYCAWCAAWNRRTPTTSTDGGA